MKKQTIILLSILLLAACGSDDDDCINPRDSSTLACPSGEDNLCESDRTCFDSKEACELSC